MTSRRLLEVQPGEIPGWSANAAALAQSIPKCGEDGELFAVQPTSCGHGAGDSHTHYYDGRSAVNQ
jgi:hypothetical protein